MPQVLLPTVQIYAQASPAGRPKNFDGTPRNFNKKLSHITFLSSPAREHNYDGVPHIIIKIVIFFNM